MLTVRKSRPDAQASLMRLMTSVYQSTLYFSFSLRVKVFLTASTTSNSQKC